MTLGLYDKIFTNTEHRGREFSGFNGNKPNDYSYINIISIINFSKAKNTISSSNKLKLRISHLFNFSFPKV
jgi:hypothetical protein